MTRRNLIELAGLTFATTVIPSGIVAAKEAARQEDAAQGVSPVMDKLSRYMSEAGERAVPDEVVEKAKHHILDTLAAMISGSEIRPGRAVIEFVRAYGGKEVATVVASNIVCGPVEAALANGVLAHADETDDSHGPSRSHPGVSVVPAAFRLPGGDAQEHARHCCGVWGRCGSRLRRGSWSAADAFAAGLQRSTNIRNWCLEPRCGAHGKGFPLWGEARGRRSHCRDADPLGLDRC